ncbi:MAG: EF-Tu/IF-2/RF-3 family GTPase [Candidatus Bathyarchaeota archaeon]|nr:EF-Tu/IF-2/RF-3 family GTPase [Candidatus Bathyarchaeota archaeon]
MPNLNIAIVGYLEYAKNFGKKSTETDITFYDAKRGETTLSMLEPSRYPEKLSSLFYAASFGDYTFFVVDKLDQYFGEVLLMLDAVGAKNGALVFRNYITRDHVTKFIKGTVVEGYIAKPDDPVILRDELFTLAEKPRGMVNLDFGTVVIDHAFNVRGIGTVALGVVREGTINKHDVLKIFPGTGKAEVRSIQKHDDDFDIAETGDRVGIALKGVELEDLPRGTVLTNNKAIKNSQIITAEARLNPFWSITPYVGMVIQIGNWMQFNLARVSEVESTQDTKKIKLILELDKPLTHKTGDTAALMYVDGGKLRVMGSMILP